MEVYIILEHQLEYGDYECSSVAGTRIVDVFLDKEDAEAQLEYRREVDKRYVEHCHCDPCEYELVTWEVQ